MRRVLDALDKAEERLVLLLEADEELLRHLLGVERLVGAGLRLDEAGFFFFFDAEREDLKFLRQRVTCLALDESVFPVSEQAARVAADPLPRLARPAGICEDE